MNIVAAKLISGEEVFAKKDTSGFGTFPGYSDIRVLMMQPRGDGKMSVGFIPYSMMNPDIQLTEAHWDKIVVTEIPTAPAIEKIYLESVSRIQLT